MNLEKDCACDGSGETKDFGTLGPLQCRIPAESGPLESKRKLKMGARRLHRIHLGIN
jgi:hypothetical protein